LDKEGGVTIMHILD